MSVNAKMTAIADKIRAKTGGTDALTLDDIAAEVPKVYDAGYEAGQSAGGGTASEPNIEPLTVTENGTYEASGDIDGYSPITVAVESEIIEPIIEPLTITENGTYTAPEGIDGYSPITVEVENEGGSLIDPSWTSFQYLFAHGRATDEAVSMLKYSDTSNGTNFSYMFLNGTMTSVPPIDTSKGTTFQQMFYNCTLLETVPSLDYSNATTINAMFYNCNKLKTIGNLNTGKCTNFGTLFRGCKELISTGSIDTSKATQMTYMYYDCSKLETIYPLNVSAVTDMGSTFGGCTSLRNVTFIGMHECNLSFANSPLLTIDSLKSIITALSDMVGTSWEGKRNLTLHAISKTNLETEGATAPNGLTWIAFAESKGWNIA